MTEYEQLKEICDKIGYKSGFEYCELNKEFYEDLMVDEGYQRQLNVREIIFTQEFMDKILDLIDKNSVGAHYIRKNICFDLMNNLNNPVKYLYNLLGLGKQ